MLTGRNVLTILDSITILGIVAVGVSFITYSGHYADLSVPAIMALSGFAAVDALPYGIGWAILAGLAAGLAVGLINGWVIGYLRVNPILWTLAMSYLLVGLLRWGHQGRQAYPDAATAAGEAFLAIAGARVLGVVPVIGLGMLLVAALGWWVMKRTRFGEQVELTGAGYDVARASGVRVRRVVLLCFVLSAGLTSLAGVILTSLSRQATFVTGAGYDFRAVTAVVLGGVALKGGKGSVFGVLGGVLLIGVLGNWMDLAGLDRLAAQPIIRGALFIAVVAIAARSARGEGDGHG